MFIYFLQEGTEGPIKIGKTDHPWRRLSALQTGNPRPVRFLVVAWLGESALGVERQLQARLRQHHIRGEWFTAHADVVEASRRFERVTCSRCNGTDMLTVGYRWHYTDRVATILCLPCGGKS